MSVTENRARVFKGAVEALETQVERLLIQLDLDIAEYDESKQDEYHMSDTLYDFDDALTVVADARNEYIEAAEIEMQTLELRWKEQ
jgi:hypothetical protein